MEEDRWNHRGNLWRRLTPFGLWLFPFDPHHGLAGDSLLTQHILNAAEIRRSYQEQSHGLIATIPPSPEILPDLGFARNGPNEIRACTSHRWLYPLIRVTCCPFSAEHEPTGSHGDLGGHV